MTWVTVWCGKKPSGSSSAAWRDSSSARVVAGFLKAEGVEGERGAVAVHPGRPEGQRAGDAGAHPRQAAEIDVEHDRDGVREQVARVLHQVALERGDGGASRAPDGVGERGEVRGLARVQRQRADGVEQRLRHGAGDGVVGQDERPGLADADMAKSGAAAMAASKRAIGSPCMSVRERIAAS
jgi:hypothetical protein